jgi:hypothetical protein
MPTAIELNDCRARLQSTRNLPLPGEVQQIRIPETTIKKLEQNLYSVTHYCSPAEQAVRAPTAPSSGRH